MAGQVARLALDGVGKSFGPTRALSDVSFQVQSGRVHALLGENGAGKSTLMNIIAGALQRDAGTMTLDGKAYAPVGPAAARGAGVAIVHQELSVCPDLTVAENVLLGVEPRRFGWVDRRRAQARVEGALAKLGGPTRTLYPHARVGDLSLAEQQLVEIARALAHDAPRLLILDEPTSSLTRDDVDRLFGALDALRDASLSIIYISHFLEEVRQVADDYTVLRDGVVVQSGRVADTRNEDWIFAIAGEAISTGVRERSTEAAPEAFACSELQGEAFTSATLSLRAGEVIGIAGLLGSGRTELLRALFGLDRRRAGSVTLEGAPAPATASRALAAGVGLLSEDRKNEGLALDLSVADNLTLSKLWPFRRYGLISPRLQRRAAEEWARRLGVRCRDVDQPVSELSGGNQQKVAIARLLHHDVEVLLLDEPTRGIDVKSRSEVHRLIGELTSRGKAVIVVSASFGELLEVCDAIAVMRRGVLGEARPVGEWTEHALLAEASGA